MLNRLNPAIQHCEMRAAECERLANLASDVASRNSYLKLAASWRKLAESRDFVAKMEQYLGYGKDQQVLSPS